MEHVTRFRPEVLQGVLMERSFLNDLWYLDDLRRLAREGFPVDLEKPVLAGDFNRTLQVYYAKYRDSRRICTTGSSRYRKSRRLLRTDTVCRRQRRLAGFPRGRTRGS